MAARARYGKDYYRILSLHPEATEEEVRRAYRRLALQWHPDRNPGDPQAGERFKEISEAYAVLMDAAKRREYDRVRLAGIPGDFRHTREDIFRDLFADPRASAIFEELAREFERMGMRVDRRLFHQTLFGGRAVVTGGVFVITPLTPVLALYRLARAALRGARIAGEVTAPAAPPLPRPQGFLEGIARAGRWLLGLPPGGAGTADTLAAGGGGSGPAAGAGPDVTYPLRLTRAEAERGGRKRITLKRGGELDEVVVTLPPGIRPGMRLRLRGKGRAAPGSRPGDLYLAIEIIGDA